MTENTSSPEPSIPPNPVPSPQREAAVSAAPPKKAAHWGQRLIVVALVVVVALLAAEWLTSRNEIRSLREDIARKLQSDEVTNSETKVIVKSAQEELKELQAKVSVLESKQVETLSQQLALEQLYQDLSKNRDEWALSEVEQVLSTASQQLQLAGNVQGALIALQNADKSLSRSDKPQFITIRRAIARDLERLKSFPTLDITGIALRLDSAISQIDGLPLLSDAKPDTPIAPPKNAQRSPDPAKPASGAGAAATDWLSRMQDKWDSWSNEMWTEVKQLLRIRRVDHPDALLLSPTQAYYARENLKLRLLNARLALLSRNESAFRSDMIASQDAIVQYFDTRSRKTETVQMLLKQIQASDLSLEVPTLVESLSAVRNYKSKH